MAMGHTRNNKKINKNKKILKTLTAGLMISC
jgi:hypothetical protein